MKKELAAFSEKLRDEQRGPAPISQEVMNELSQTASPATKFYTRMSKRLSGLEAGQRRAKTALRTFRTTACLCRIVESELKARFPAFWDSSEAYSLFLRGRLNNAIKSRIARGISAVDIGLADAAGARRLRKGRRRVAEGR